MILLQAAIALGPLILLFMGGSLLFGIPITTYLLNLRSRRRSGCSPSKSLPTRTLLLNCLLAILITVGLLFLLLIALDYWMRDWYT